MTIKIADEVGYDLSEVAQNNLDKLADRATLRQPTQSHN